MCGKASSKIKIARAYPPTSAACQQQLMSEHHLAKATVVIVPGRRSIKQVTVAAVAASARERLVLAQHWGSPLDRDKGREENLHKDNTTYFSTNLVEQHDPTLIQGSSASSLSAQV